MGKIIYYTRLFLLTWLLFSCGTNNFAKRKFTKGVYVEKRSHGSTKPSKKLSTKNNPLEVINSKGSVTENATVTVDENVQNPIKILENQNLKDEEKWNQFGKELTDKEPLIENPDISYEYGEIKPEEKQIRTSSEKNNENDRVTKGELALIFGILGIFMWFMAIPAIILGLKSNRTSKSKEGKAGLIIGITTLVLYFIVLPLIFLLTFLFAY